MEKIRNRFLLIVALVVLMAFNVIGIHHHHHQKAVPIVVELLACNGEDSSEQDDCCAHGDGHTHAAKCSYQLAAVKLVSMHLDKDVLAHVVGVIASLISIDADLNSGVKPYREYVPFLPAADLQQRQKRGPPASPFFYKIQSNY